MKELIDGLIKLALWVAAIVVCFYIVKWIAILLLLLLISLL